jgi:putative ABC transport system substrate-binding protein
MAADLVRRQVAVIVGDGTAAPLAAKALTSTIPIVFSAAIDPVQSGLVSSFSRPDCNVTGVFGMGAELGTKRFKFLHELLPRAQRFGVLINPGSPSADNEITDIRAAAATIGREIVVVYASHPAEIDDAFVSLHQKGAEGVLISAQFLFNERYVQIIGLAVQHGMPLIYGNREWSKPAA